MNIKKNTLLRETLFLKAAIYMAKTTIFQKTVKKLKERRSKISSNLKIKKD